MRAKKKVECGFMGNSFISLWARVGSYAMGAAHPHDVDYVCWATSQDILDAHEWFSDNGWRESGTRSYKNFLSFRRMEHNVILVSKESAFFGFVGAFFLCKKYKVLAKADRVLIHEGMRLLHWTGVVFNDNPSGEVVPLDVIPYGWGRDDKTGKRYPRASTP